MREFAKIVLLCVGAAVLYGELHDQVTARVCVEYFSVAHPRVIASESPTALAIVWGFLATWWVGVILGVPLGLFARVGGWPKLSARDFRAPLAILLICMGVLSLLAGLAGAAQAAAHRGAFRLHFVPPAIADDKVVPFTADAFAHQAAYGAGFFGGIVLWGWTIVRRWRAARSPS
ncbi:MAG: hypothetical protein HYZ53_22745 [Planctomycetes bacterium]|nr:hypothetical protein [Planctomycetota bacterium]